MKIKLTSVPVGDQEQALQFYTNVLGFEKKIDMPMGEYRWLTVVSPEEQDAAQLLLEPNAHPAAKAYQEALFADGIPVSSFEVVGLQSEFERLSALNVRFTTEPSPAGDTTIAVLDDTCGNLIMLYEAT